MKNLIEKLEKKFDEYHKEQLRIDNNQNPDYYLFMGKASAIGDLIDELKIEMNISVEEINHVFKEWADTFFATRFTAIPTMKGSDFKYLDCYFSKEMAYENFVKATTFKKWTVSKFKNELKLYCQISGYIFNPESLQNFSERIIRKMEFKTQEVFYIQTKATHP
jgi:hypothetical protein